MRSLYRRGDRFDLSNIPFSFLFGNPEYTFWCQFFFFKHRDISNTKERSGTKDLLKGRERGQIDDLEGREPRVVNRVEVRRSVKGSGRDGLFEYR